LGQRTSRIEILNNGLARFSEACSAGPSERIRWNGKAPRFRAAWTQNGQVVDANGKMIGTYERTIEFGGDTGKKQEMLVFLHD
jgi:hypothetical protein